MAAEEIDQLVERLKQLSTTFESLNSMENRLIKEGYNREQAKKKVELEAISRQQQLNNINKDLVSQARHLAKAEMDAERQARTLAGRLEAAAGASVQAQKALLTWTARTKAMGETLKHLGDNLGSFAKNLAEGGTKFTDLNPLVDAVSGSLGKMAEAIPYAGNFFSGAMKAAGEATKFLLGQLQTATTTFQEVGRVGGLTATGMDGLLRQFQSSGMTLEGFKKALTENSKDLAAFGGTVGAGAERFSQITQDIIDSGAGDYLRRLGFTADEMGNSTARFIAMQNRLGLAQSKTTQELARSSENYMKQLDLLARVTGQSRDESQRRLDEMLRENRFQAELADLVNQGRVKEAENLQNLALALDASNKELGQAFRATVGGIMTDDLSKAFNTVGVNVMKFSDDIKYNGKGYMEVLKDAQRQVRDAKPAIISLGKIFDETGKVIPNVRDALQFAEADINNVAAAADQNKVQTDELTGTAANAQKSMEQMSRQMGALIRTTLPNFGKAIETVTGTLNDMLQKLGIQGVVGGPAAGGGGARGGGGPAGRGPGAPQAPITGPGGPAAPGAAGTLESVRNLIGRAESGGDYNVMVGGQKGDLTNMTLAQILEQQKKMRAPGSGFASSALGKYQITYDTLRDLINKTGLDPTTTKFDEATQDMLANDLIVYRAQYNKYASGAITKERFLKNLSSIWRGLPNAPGMKAGMPTDQVGNKARLDWDQAIQMFQKGGIFDKRQGLAMLHGPEAVVPLPDGKSIPVEIKQPLSGLGNSLTDIIQTINDQKQNLQTVGTGAPKFDQEVINVLKESAENLRFNNQLVDSLVSLQRENNSLNERILRATHN